MNLRGRQVRPQKNAAAAAATHLRSLRSDLLHEPDDGAAQFCIFDARERPYQVQAVGSGEEVAHERRRRSIIRLLGRWPAERVRRTFEEKWDRHLKDVGDVLQAAGGRR
jgi:hypothetical protein